MERFEGGHVTRLEIRLLGPFSTVLDGELVTDFESDSARALLGHLAAEQGRRRSRAVLAEMLWPERPQGAALSNLRHVLSVLRKALGEQESDPNYLLADRHSVMIAATPDVWVDLMEFERLATTSADQADAVDAWERAVLLVRGTLLEGVHVRAGMEWDEWMMATAEQVRRHLSRVFCSLAVHHERLGEWDLSIQAVERLIEVDPWNERGHRQLMRLLAGSGDEARALAHFAEMSDRLHSELSAAPSARTAALATRIRAGTTSRTGPTNEITYPRFLTTARPTLESPPFVGREHELGYLFDHLEAAVNGDGHVVVIAGEAGSGKTMLAAEFMQRATETADLLVVQGRCNAYGGLGDPYLPFREVLGQLTGDVEASLAAGAMGREQATRLWEAIPHTASLTYERGPSLLGIMVNGMLLVGRAEQAVPGEHWLEGLRNRAEAVTNRPPLPERMQPALFDEYTALLHGVADVYPLLIVIDDLQWADRASIALLWHLARRLEGQRILIVGLYRPEELSESGGAVHPLDPVIHELQADMPDCTIELDRDRSFIDALVDSEPNDLNEEFREQLFSYTDGHPLFTVELVRAMQERADIRRSRTGAWTAHEALDWHGVPRRVEAVIEQRITRLPEDLQRDLVVAAVQGEEFIAETVAAVQDDPDTSVRLRMESSSPHRIIEPSRAARVDGQLVAHYRFRHILFQRYLYGQLGDAERIRLHEATGRALEELFRSHPEQPVVDLAHHFDEAGLKESAITYMQLAGQRAFRMSANEEAIRHLQRAVVLLADLPENGDRDQRELDMLCLLGGAVMAMRGYSTPEAARIGQRIGELCGRLDPSPTIAVALQGMSTVLTIRGLHRDSLSVAREVLAIGEGLQNSGLTVLGHYSVGYEEMWQGELSSGHNHLTTARQAYDAEQHGWLMHALGLAVGPEAMVWDAFNLAHAGYRDEAIRLADEGIALARSIGHPFTLCHALGIGGGLVRMICGEYEVALRRNEEFEAVAKEEHFEFWAIAADMYRGTAMGYVKDPDSGLSILCQGLDAWEAMGVRAFRGYWHAEMAGIEQQAGRPEQGLEIVERELSVVAESLERLSHVHLLVRRSSLMGELGGSGEAIGAAKEAVGAARGIGARLLELRAATDLATVLEKAGRSPESEEALAPIYAWFTEGFDAPDLVAAKAVLQRI